MLALATSVCFWAFLLGGAYEFTCPPAESPAGGTELAIPFGAGHFIPVIVTSPTPSRVHGVIVVLHGSAGNVQEYFSDMILAAKEAKCGGAGILVVAPAFPVDTSCTQAQWTGDSSEDVALAWSDIAAWAAGENDNRESGSVSSFAVIDKLIEWSLATHQWLLEAVVVTGFSTGAQLALRWAIFSAEGEDKETAAVRPYYQDKLPMRIIVGAPSTFTYLSGKRPTEDCTENEETTSDFSCNTFAVPESGSRRRGTQVQKTCSGTYDDYQYGLGDLSASSDSPATRDVANYLGSVMDLADVPQYLRARFKTKDVRFLIGTEDNKDCGEGICTDNCAANTTGTNRMQRMLNYMGHLQEALSPGYTPSYGVYIGPHNQLLAFRSEDKNNKSQPNTSFVLAAFPVVYTDGTCQTDNLQANGATSLVAPRLLLACFGFMLPLARQLFN